MNNDNNTSYNLLEDLVARMSEYPDGDEVAADKAWKDLGVAMVVLLLTLQKADVVDGVLKTLVVAGVVADQITKLDEALNG